MIQKILKYLVPAIIIFLLFGVTTQYYISMKLAPEDLICHKGKLLAQLESETPVYTKIKDIECEVIGGRMVLNYE